MLTTKGSGTGMPMIGTFKEALEGAKVLLKAACGDDSKELGVVGDCSEKSTEGSTSGIEICSRRWL